MDFVTHLPETDRGYNAITTIADRLSRRVHFIPSKVTDSAADCSTTFFNEIFRLHGMPGSIISDRDPKFTATFWFTLMDLCNVKLRMSTSHHLQTDCSSKFMDLLVENYLQCYALLNQAEWDTLLLSADFSFNSSHLNTTGYTTFKLVYRLDATFSFGHHWPKPRHQCTNCECPL